MTGSLAPSEGWDDLYPEHPVNELLSSKPGAQSPFGDELTFPLPVSSIYYQHPSAEDRPNLAGH